MSFFKQSRDVLGEQISEFKQRYPDYIDLGVSAVESTLLSKRELLPAIVAKGQAKFIEPLRARGALTTDEMIRQIDKIRATPLWSRVTGSGDYILRIIEQFEHPANSLLVDALITDATAEDVHQMGGIRGALRAAVEALGREEIPKKNISLEIFNQFNQSRHLMLLKAQFMQLSVIRLDDGQSLEEAIAAASTKYLIVNDGASLIFINRDTGGHHALRGRGDLKRFLATEPAGQFLSSSFQEFAQGFPPERLEHPADITPLLDEADREVLARLQLVEQWFLDMRKDLMLSDEYLRGLNGDYNQRLTDLGFTATEGDFSTNFLFALNALLAEEVDGTKLLKLIKLWNQFTTVNYNLGIHKQHQEIFAAYQATCFEILPKLDLDRKMSFFQQQKLEFDRVFRANVAPLLGMLPELIGQREHQWESELARMAETLRGEIEGLEKTRDALPTGRGSKKLQKQYNQDIAALTERLDSLSLANQLAKADFASWNSLKMAIDRRPLVLTDKHLIGLGQLIYNHPPHAIAEQKKLQHLIGVINFSAKYQDVLSLEHILDQVSARIDRINRVMVALAPTAKTGETKAEYHRLQREKLALQQELPYLTTKSEEFSNLSDEEKLAKIPAIWARLSADDRAFLQNLSHGIDGLYALSQYPAARYLGELIPGPLGVYLSALDTSFAAFQDRPRPMMGAGAPSVSRP